MKITASINLGSFFFNIDEDVYSELKRYLRNLELNFAGEESASEIISDVNEVISIMGSPENISNDEGPSRKEKFLSPGPHRMYRDPDRRIIGGVCAGMGAYWDFESWLIRIIFLALVAASGLGILIYLILYIVLPEARTTAQKIEMKGDPVNIHNIKEAVKNEFNTVRKI